MVKPVSMAAFKLFKFLQLFANLDKTKMSKAGCRWLSKVNWKSLDTILLRRREII